MTTSFSNEEAKWNAVFFGWRKICFKIHKWAKQIKTTFFSLVDKNPYTQSCMPQIVISDFSGIRKLRFDCFWSWIWFRKLCFLPWRNAHKCIWNALLNHFPQTLERFWWSKKRKRPKFYNEIIRLSSAWCRYASIFLSTNLLVKKKSKNELPFFASSRFFS